MTRRERHQELSKNPEFLDQLWAELGNQLNFEPNGHTDHDVDVQEACQVWVNYFLNGGKQPRNRKGSLKVARLAVEKAIMTVFAADGSPWSEMNELTIPVVERITDKKYVEDESSNR